MNKLLVVLVIFIALFSTAFASPYDSKPNGEPKKFADIQNEFELEMADLMKKLSYAKDKLQKELSN